MIDVWAEAQARIEAAVNGPPPLPPELATPLGFAETHSRGAFRRYPHVELMEKACLETIATGGRLILSVSVRHGKTEFASHWLPAWYIATHPDARVILAGHEADFAATHGRKARDILHEHGHEYGVAVSPKSEAASRWDLKAPHTGGMLTVGVGGSPIGRGADLMIVDDPIKGIESAMSPLVRQRMKEWYTGTMSSRVEPGGAVIIICARWHEDDLSGFLLREAGDKWTELRLPAIADEDDDQMGRQVGEPLWPERWPLDLLAERHAEVSLTLGEQTWNAQYQQTPKTPVGGMFPADRWGMMPPNHEALHGARWCRSWDLAASVDRGDWTVGVLIGALRDGRTVIGDVRRGRWSSDQVRMEIMRAARSDTQGTMIELPQDPAQAGKDQAEQLARLVVGYDVRVTRDTKAKDVRATGYSAQQQAGNVVLIDGEWQGAFIAEHMAFPTGTHDDQVDAAASGFNRLFTATATATTQSTYRMRTGSR